MTRSLECEDLWRNDEAMIRESMCGHWKGVEKQKRVESEAEVGVVWRPCGPTNQHGNEKVCHIVLSYSMHTQLTLCAFVQKAESAFHCGTLGFERAACQIMARQALRQTIGPQVSV